MYVVSHLQVQQRFEHVLFLTYEQLLANPQVQIRTMADFAGIHCTAEILAKASALLSIKTVKGVSYSTRP